MTDKEKYAIKIAIDTMDKYNSRYWNTRYGSLKTGVSVWYGEAISILSDMVRDNDSKQTNADRIRNMSDTELADWIYYHNTKFSSEMQWFDWLQSKAE
jgi:hypothetical protein